MLGEILGWGAWSAVIAGTVAWLTARGTIRFNREKLQREFQLEFATEAALKALLNAGEYKMRSFERIKHHLPGFADDIRDARAAKSPESLSELYDPDFMPPELRKAHAALDRAVDRLYRSRAFASERDRVEHLFELYETRVAPLAPSLKAKRRPKAA
jgi:hypothetical protein